jgi:HEAT repeat protein
MLAWLDLLIVGIIGAVFAVYLRIGRTLSPVNLLAVTLFFFASNAVLFRWAVSGPGAHPLLVPALYVWAEIFGVVAIAQVWTLFGFVLTGREAKRLVGFVGSGGILGGIAGGLLSRFMAARFGAESLLLSMAACIVAAVALVLVIAAQNRNLAQPADSPSADGGMKLQEGLRLVLSSPHLRIIAALIWVSALTLNIAGWQFKAIMQVAFDGNQDTISQFRGTFDSITGALALTIQIFVTSRLLRHWGIRAALLILPLGLVGGSVTIVASASGALWAATLLAGTYKSVRNSVDTAALQVLYMPVTPEVRVRAKPFLDTVAQRSGEGLGALAILLLTRFFNLAPAQFGWVLLGLLLVWLVIARKAGFQYLATLGDTLRQRRLSAEALQEHPVDRSATQVLGTELRSNDPVRIIYALDLLGEQRWRIVHASIRQLLTHPAPRVRAKAVSILRLMSDTGATPAVEALIRDPEIDVRTEALLFLSQLAGIDPLARIQNLGDYPDFSVQAATIVFLARSGEIENVAAARFILDRMIADRETSGRAARLEAARLIRFVPEEFAPYLCALLEDVDHDVLREAARTAGGRQNLQYVSPLVQLLGNPDVRQSAIDALALFGKRIQDHLGELLSNDKLPLGIRREIPDLLL